MVEHIIERHIAAGSFARQPHGVVYRLPGELPGESVIHSITGNVMHSRGFHARPVTEFVQAARKLGVDPTYVIVPGNDDGRRYGSSRSIMSLLFLAAGQHTPVTLVSDHHTAPEALATLYRIVMGQPQ